MAQPTCLSFPTEFPYELDSFGSNSGLNSPVDSVLSSTDDDEFFVALAQQLAWTSFCETEKSLSPCFNPNKFEKCCRTGSPQSTLSGFDFECSKSPLMAVLGAENDAREAARLKMSGEKIPYHNNYHFIRGFVGVRPSISVKSTNDLDYGLFSNENCARNLAFQMQQLSEDLLLQALCARRQAKVGWAAQSYWKPEINNRDGNTVQVSGRCSGGSGGLFNCPWLLPPLNQQSPLNTSAVRCIHPGGSGIKRVSSGTGVFLPRRHLNPSDCRQKRGIPANRFAEEIINPNQAPLNYCQLPGFDSISSRRNNPLLPMPRSFPAEVNQELHLPQEWTY